jgi:hypothetical protein
VYNVFIDSVDPALPRLALFAPRTIESGEELTFDYLRGHHEDATLRAPSPTRCSLKSSAKKRDDSKVTSPHRGKGEVTSPHRAKEAQASRNEDDVLNAVTMETPDDANENDGDKTTAKQNTELDFDTFEAYGTPQDTSAMNGDVDGSHGMEPHKEQAHKSKDKHDGDDVTIGPETNGIESGPTNDEASDAHTRKDAMDIPAANVDAERNADGSTSKETTSKSNGTSQRRMMKCLCKSKNCRGYLFLVGDQPSH